MNEGELLDIAQNVSEAKGNFDPNQLMLDIEKYYGTVKWTVKTSSSCKEMVCFADFLKTFRKALQHKEKE